MHGKLEILGFVIERLGLAYVTDASALPEKTMAFLVNMKPAVLVVNALRPKEHPTHFTIAQALAVVHEIDPTRAYFIHMAHNVSYSIIVILIALS